MTERQRHKKRETYADAWGSQIGQDCISLDVALGRWLGERLTYLSERDPLGCPSGYSGGAQAWRQVMSCHGRALSAYGQEEVRDETEVHNAIRSVDTCVR